MDERTEASNVLPPREGLEAKLSCARLIVMTSDEPGSRHGELIGTDFLSGCRRHLRTQDLHIKDALALQGNALSYSRIQGITDRFTLDSTNADDGGK